MMMQIHLQTQSCAKHCSLHKVNEVGPGYLELSVHSGLLLCFLVLICDIISLSLDNCSPTRLVNKQLNNQATKRRTRQSDTDSTHALLTLDLAGKLSNLPVDK